MKNNELSGVTVGEFERLRRAYSRRSEAKSSVYTPFDPSYLLIRWWRERALLSLLKFHGIKTLSGMRILEVGCGGGEILRQFLDYGAESKNLYGIDLLSEELAKGKDRSVDFKLCCADGRRIPFPDKSFDLVVQYTVFTSILDDGIRRELANEMLRVLKWKGLIVSYDFIFNNPSNPDVRQLTERATKGLFQHCSYYIDRIVLAPPILRRLAPVSILACQALERIPWLCTHVMIGMRPNYATYHDLRPPLFIPSLKDLDQIVRIHLASFPGFFLTFLGPRILRMLYKFFLTTPDGIAFGYHNSNRIVGFAFGSTNPSTFYRRFFRQNWWRIVLVKGWSPRAIVRILMRLSGHRRTLLRDALDRPAATLFFIAVHPEYQNKKVGKTLIQRFLFEVRGRGMSLCDLTTDRDGNEATNAFYLRRGFKLARSFQANWGRMMNEYFIELEGKPPHA